MIASESRVRERSFAPWVILALSLVAALAMFFYEFGLLLPHARQSRIAANAANGYFFGNDLYPIWLTARQPRPRDLYGTEVTRAIQAGLFGRPMDPHNQYDPAIEYREFAYPAFTDVVLWPASLLDFTQVRLLMAVLLPVLTVTSLWFWLGALDWRVTPLWFCIFVVLALSSYQLLEAFFAEQPALLVSFFLAATAFAVRKGRLLLAGTFAALTLIKPQMTLLAIFYLLVWSFSDRTRARFWQAFFAVLTALMIASLCIWPNWIQGWFHVLLGYHHYAQPPLILVLLGTLVPRSAAILLTIGMLAAAVVLLWRNRKLRPDSTALWFTLAILLALTSITLLPGQAVYDHVILIPAILLVLRYARALSASGKAAGVLFTIGLFTALWQWIAAFLLLLLQMLVPRSFPDSMLTLPLRTAAPLPFVALFLVWWTRRVITSERGHA